jgi:membrane-associated phospholipid phosphatase
VLVRADEFRPAPPPASGSDRAKAALAEVKTYKRTPASNHRAVYWEVFGGARGFALWNEIVRTKLLEYGTAFDAPTSARAFAALNVAYWDATIACFDAKYAYWYIRPSQLDPGLKPVFAPPNHPSYPAAHGCLSTAAATVLAALFPRDRQRLLALAKEAAEARIWAGIHYRFDIEAGQALGRKVGEKVLARAFMRPER